MGGYGCHDPRDRGPNLRVVQLDPGAAEGRFRLPLAGGRGPERALGFIELGLGDHLLADQTLGPLVLLGGVRPLHSGCFQHRLGLPVAGLEFGGVQLGQQRTAADLITDGNVQPPPRPAGV